MLDPGHGGTDSGAISVNGHKEKDIVLDLAKDILYWNKIQFEDKYEIYLTRSGDTLISLAHRTKLANHIKPDFFLSLHCNHAANNGAKGLEIYISGNIDSSASTSFGVSNISERMLEEISNNIGFENRGVKIGNFYVLRETTGKYPAVLIELGFLSNRDESEHLANKKKRRVLALAIIMAI